MIVRIFGGAIIGSLIGVMIGYFGKCSSGACPLTANPFRGAVFGGLVGVLFSLSFANCTCCKSPTTPEQAIITETPEKSKTKPEATQEAVIHVNNETDFKKYVLESELPCLADFFPIPVRHAECWRQQLKG